MNVLQQRAMTVTSTKFLYDFMNGKSYAISNKQRVTNANKCTDSEPAQTTPELADWGREAREKKGPIAVKRGPERALLVVKGRIG